jgi:hypothetical protein
MSLAFFELKDFLDQWGEDLIGKKSTPNAFAKFQALMQKLNIACENGDTHPSCSCS